MPKFYGFFPFSSRGKRARMRSETILEIVAYPQTPAYALPTSEGAMFELFTTLDNWYFFLPSR
jgi:hypothetical protein